MPDDLGAVLAVYPMWDGSHWAGCHLGGRGHVGCAVAWLVARVRVAEAAAADWQRLALSQFDQRPDAPDLTDLDLAAYAVARLANPRAVEENEHRTARLALTLPALAPADRAAVGRLAAVLGVELPEGPQ